MLTHSADAVDAAVMKQCYKANLHPKVISGELSEDEAFLDFLSKFADANNDGTVTHQEWSDHWNMIAKNIPEEEHFVTMMAKAWGL